MIIALAVIALVPQTLIGSRASTESSVTEPYHLELKSTRKVRITSSLTRKSSEPVTAWDAIAASPPELAGQHFISKKLYFDSHLVTNAEFQDESGLHVGLLGASFTAAEIGHRDPVEVKAIYEGTILRFELVPGAPTTLAKPLSAEERRLDLKETDQVDFKDSKFRRFLTQSRLIREPQEGVIEFARRVYRYLRTKMIYEAKADTPFAWSTCSQDIVKMTGHCGTYSRLAVAIYRANGIPSRIQFGHWFMTSGTFEGGHPHTRAEFFADGIGWILSDPSYSVTAGPWKPEQDVDCGFGGEASDFITLNLHCPIFFRTRNFGVIRQEHFQGIYFPAVGGTWEGGTYTHNVRFEILQ